MDIFSLPAGQLRGSAPLTAEEVAAYVGGGGGVGSVGAQHPALAVQRRRAGDQPAMPTPGGS